MRFMFLSLPAGLGLLPLLALLAAPAAAAQEPPEPQQVLALSPAIAEAAPAAAPRGSFFERTVVARLPAGPLLLAASPDGAEALCADDSARLTLESEAAPPVVWEHRFSTPDRRAIACVEPLQLGALAAAGTYSVTLTLTDLRGPTYSARPFFLLALGETMAVAPTSSATVAATATPPARPTVTPPAAIVAPLPGVTAVPSPPVAADVLEPQREFTLPLWLIVGGLLALGALLVLLARRRPRSRPGSGVSGILTLADSSSREVRTAIVVGGRSYTLRRRPLALVSQGVDGDALATLSLDLAGLHVRATDGGEQLVVPDSSLALAEGAVTLHYRAQGAPRPRGAQLPKGLSR